MDINTLNAFLAVAEERSFSLAAERLHLTQPAVSKRVKALEEELGTPLFDRVGRQVNLTEAGRRLAPRARDLLQEIHDLRRSLSNLSGEVTGVLSMGTSHHIGLHRLPPILRGFARQYPQVQLDIRFLGSEAACSAVEHGELELGIVTLPIEPSPRLTLTPLWTDPLFLTVSADHPLTRLDQPTLSDLTDHPAVLPEQGTVTRDILEQAVAPLGIALRVAISTNYLETLKMLVTTGIGWSLLPGTMVHGEGLRVLELPELRLSRTLGAVTHRNRTLSNAARAMLERCIGSASLSGEDARGPAHRGENERDKMGNQGQPHPCKTAD